MTSNKLPKVPFTYQGSKLGELNVLKRHIRPDSKILEPFLGTGVVSLNFGRVGHCHGNDLNRDIYCIWTHAGSGEFESAVEHVMRDDLRTQEHYYSIRDEFNRTYHGTEVYNPYRAALFYYLVNSCHAGMVRYGPNGFNSPFKLFLLHGRKYHTRLRLDLLNETRERLVGISSLDANTLLDKMWSDLDRFDLVYCDPPYTVSASKYLDLWSDDDLLELDDRLYRLSKRGVRSLMSNYYNPDLELKGTVVERFEKKRMATTKVTDYFSTVMVRDQTT